MMPRLRSRNSASGASNQYPLGSQRYLNFPNSLGVPHNRFGFDFATTVGRPREYLSTGAEDFAATSSASPAGFFGRFLLAERSDPDFAFPGNNWSPFDQSSAFTLNANGLIVDGKTSGSTSYGEGTRAGVDLLMTNVHGFDLQVWDDVVKDWVNLGHNLQGNNPYVKGTPLQDGFYHQSRLRKPVTYDPMMHGPWNSLTHDLKFDLAGTSDFGNRFDTWHPRAAVSDDNYSPNPARIFRTGRAPYRPSLLNVTDPNDPAFVDVGNDDTTFKSDPALNDDAIAPLRGVRIVVRYYDTVSGQTRRVTLDQSLID